MMPPQKRKACLQVRPAHSAERLPILLTPRERPAREVTLSKHSKLMTLPKKKPAHSAILKWPTKKNSPAHSTKPSSPLLHVVHSAKMLQPSASDEPQDMCPAPDAGPLVPSRNKICKN